MKRVEFGRQTCILRLHCISTLAFWIWVFKDYIYRCYFEISIVLGLHNNYEIFCYWTDIVLFNPVGVTPSPKPHYLSETKLCDTHALFKKEYLP